MIGGIFTILTRLAILSYLIYGLTDVYYQKNSIVKKTLYRDMFVDKTKIHLTPEIFDVGISFQFVGDVGDATDNLFRYFELNIAHIEVKYNSDGTLQSGVTPLSFSLCSTNRFGGNQQVIETMGLTSYYCPDSLDFEIFGSQTGESSQFILYMNQCTNETLLERNILDYTCAPKDAIEKVFDLALAQLVVMSSYFDAYEFDVSPIKKQYKTYIYAIGHDFGQGQDIYIADNELITYDSQVGSFFGGQSIKYHDTILGKTYTGAVKKDIIPQLGIYFMISSQVDTTTRTVRSIMDCLTETGGFSNVIGLIAKFTILKLQQQLFYESLIKKIFKVQLKSKRQSKKAQNRHKGITDLDETEKPTAMDDSDIAKHLSHCIPLRVPPDIYILKQRVLKLFCFCKSKRNSEERIQYENALTMIDSQFDIVKLIQSVRSSHLLQKLILSHTQRQLIPYFAENIIPTHSLNEKQSKRQDHKRSLDVNDHKNIEKVIRKMIDKSKESSVNYKIVKELISHEDHEIDQSIKLNLRAISKSKDGNKNDKKRQRKTRNNQKVQLLENSATISLLKQPQHHELIQPSLRKSSSSRKMLEPISESSHDFRGDPPKVKNKKQNQDKMGYKNSSRTNKHMIKNEEISYEE